MANRTEVNPGGIKLGDVVRLPSGGSAFTVTDVDPGTGRVSLIGFCSDEKLVTASNVSPGSLVLDPKHAANHPRIRSPWYRKDGALRLSADNIGCAARLGLTGIRIPAEPTTNDYWRFAEAVIRHEMEDDAVTLPPDLRLEKP